MIPELDGFPAGEALFDMDGTLISNDIAEACLRGIDRTGHRNRVTEREESVFAAYNAIVSYEEQCIYAAVALGGLTVSGVEALVDHAFAAAECAPVASVCELAHWMARRHRVWLLTGSPEAIGAIVGRRLGLRNFYGIKQGRHGAELTTETYGTATCGEGKVRAAWVMTGRVPTFAIGDTPHDLPLLRHARVARTCGRLAGVEFAAFP